MTIIHITAPLGHVNLSLHYLDNHVFHTDILDQFEPTPLFYGLLRSHGDVVRMPLDQGVNVKADAC